MRQQRLREVGRVIGRKGTFILKTRQTVVQLVKQKQQVCITVPQMEPIKPSTKKDAFLKLVLYETSCNETTFSPFTFIIKQFSHWETLKDKDK